MTIDHREIARKLTKPQREQVLRGAVGGDFRMQTVRALIAKGLMAIEVDNPNGLYWPCVLTDRGRIVRQCLIAGGKPQAAAGACGMTVERTWDHGMTIPSDEALLRTAVRIAVPRHSRGYRPRWQAVMDVLSVGSNTAWALCNRFGFDPEEKVRRK